MSGGSSTMLLIFRRRLLSLYTHARANAVCSLPPLPTPRQPAWGGVERAGEAASSTFEAASRHAICFFFNHNNKIGLAHR